ncbi:hypothetical protein FHU33_3136 [Blastococcus colisei]|uniref:Uncharacterized protein n=1 Tax=Blastococcus colisei TaxID=1564162 RepID=A0A543PHW0_9ACTN|nr:hypothetical protein [Blastococcus colisei]TQN43676.1 hypothetical protein FHU33_3136 [Blastococcus colisei]
MLTYAQILYGVALTAVGVAVLTVLVPRWRRLELVLTAVVVASVAVLAWQFVLRATHASQFFTDLPFRLFPISRQDPGSGVAAFALTALVLAYGPCASSPHQKSRTLRWPLGRLPCWWTSTSTDWG